MRLNLLYITWGLYYGRPEVSATLMLTLSMLLCPVHQRDGENETFILQSSVSETPQLQSEVSARLTHGRADQTCVCVTLLADR